jgi:rfaE bifunctional protein kinase chain/domain
MFDSTPTPAAILAPSSHLPILSREGNPQTKADILTHLSHLKILLVGDVMLDRYWFCDVHRISPEAPVPVALVQQTQDRAGGAANVAVNLAALGVQTTLLSPLGNDEHANALSDVLSAYSRITFHGVSDPQLKTTLKLRIMGQHQQLLRVDMENQPSSDSLKQLEQRYLSLLPLCDLVIFSDYAKGTLGQIQSLIQHAKKQNKLVLVDPKGQNFARYQGADLITPNRSELKAVIGSWLDEGDLTKRVGQLCSQENIQYLVLTRSEEGMSLFSTHEHEHVHVPANAKEVFDVTGAGDTVLATLAALVGIGITPNQAVFYANRAGGIKVGKLGTAPVGADELLQNYPNS